MSNNLLESLKEHLSGDVVSNLASLLGDSPKNTESALNTALPALLAGLVEQSGNPQSIGKLFNLLTEGTHNGGILSNLGALSLGGEETNKLISQGANLLSSLFGDKVGGITDLIGKSSGLSKTGSSSVLGFLTPIVLGMIGKHLKIDNISSAAGLAEFLGSQKGFLQNFIPAGLSGVLSGGYIGESSVEAATTAASALDKATSSFDVGDVGDYLKDKVESVGDTLGDMGDKIEDVVEDTFSSAKDMAKDIGESASQFGSQLAHEGKEYAHSTAEAIEEGAGEGKKFLPWLLIAAALALVWGLLKSCSTPETAPEATTSVTTAPTMPAPDSATPPPVEPVVATPAEPAAPAPTESPKVEAPAPDTAPASDAYEKTLASGYAIKAAKDGFESKLLGFIEGSEAISKDLWFTMDGIQFDTNKASIRKESEAQVNHIAEILKAYPKVEIKIGGYTDNTGKANANKKLSNNRALAVKKAIVGKGVKADRIDAEGYGSDHPVASNDTTEGRQQNRRIDVRVTEK